MIKKLEKYIEFYKKAIEDAERKANNTSNEYNEAYMLGYKDGLESSLIDVEALLEHAKMQKEFE